MPGKKILIVDDEKNIRDIVKAYLEKEDYRVFTASDGIEAMEILSVEKIDLLILDLMMPNMNGEEVCARVRLRSNMPIIMLTAKVEEENVIDGIKGGADDYIKKPFSVRELMVRVAALFRRLDGSEPLLEVYRYNNDDLVVDFRAMSVRKKGQEVDLTPNEFKILKTFIQNAEIVLTRNQIIEKTFGIQFDGFDRTIDSHIKNIRHKIEGSHKNPDYIKTVYSMGYKFCTDMLGDNNEENEN